MKKEKTPTSIKSIDIKDNYNNTVGKVEVEVLENISNAKIAKVVRWQQSKARVGTHRTKDVSQLAYSTRKIRKQKGGGCARFRNKGAPQFRGGATVHGPDDRKYAYSMNKKERLLGLKHALSLKAKKGLVVLQEINLKSTVKSFKEFLKTHHINDTYKKKILIVDMKKQDSILKAINNVYGANFLPVIGLNVESVIKSEQLIFTVEAINQLKERGVF